MFFLVSVGSRMPKALQNVIRGWLPTIRGFASEPITLKDVKHTKVKQLVLSALMVFLKLI